MLFDKATIYGLN